MNLKLVTGIAGAALFSAGLAFGQSQPVSNSGFEAWHNYSVFTPLPIQLSVPDGWSSSDSMVAAFAPMAALGNIDISPEKQVYKSTDSHDGQYAAQLISKNLGDVGVQPAALSNGKIDIDLMSLLTSGNFDPSQILNYIQFKGGESVTGQVDSVSAWLKNGDTAQTDNYGFMAIALKEITNDSFVVVGQGFKSITPNLSQYTQVSININYPDPNAIPDKLVVVFTSSDMTDTLAPVTANNSLLVDDVVYTMGSTGIKIPLMSENALLVYPVPASQTLYFNLKSENHPTDYTLRISNMEGRVISTEQLSNQINAKDVRNWTRGIYFYQLINTQTNQQQTGKFILK